MCCLNEFREISDVVTETSVNFYKNTRQSELENNHIHTRRCNNLKSYVTYGLKNLFNTLVGQFVFPVCPWFVLDESISEPWTEHASVGFQGNDQGLT